MSNLSNLSLVQLKRAVQIKEQIEKLQSELSSVFGSSGPSPKPSTGSSMSEATKAKLRAAAKARWSKIKSGKQVSAPIAKSSAAPVRKPMSAAGKARLSALAKARWAKIKASGKKGF